MKSGGWIYSTEEVEPTQVPPPPGNTGTKRAKEGVKETDWGLDTVKNTLLYLRVEKSEEEKAQRQQQQCGGVTVKLSSFWAEQKLDNKLDNTMRLLCSSVCVWGTGE